MAAETTKSAAAGDDAIGVVALHNFSSEELAWRAGQGCRASFTELVRRYAPRLSAFLCRRTRDRHEVEDLVQDTFLRVYENIERYDRSWRFSTWLFTIAARTAISHHRRRRPTCAALDVPVGACDAAAERREERENLWSLAAELPERQYQALRLKYNEDMSIEEIARVMGKSQVCIKVLLYRARTALARRLTETHP